MRVLIVANSCPWTSWSDKIAAIKAFYAPLVALDIDIKYTEFTDVPLKSYPGTITDYGPNGAVDVAGSDLEIDQEWFAENVIPLASGYDIVVFQAANVAATGLPLGVKFGQINGIMCCETFVPGEDFDYFLPGVNGQPGVNLGNEAVIDIEHELSHALYAISGQTDNTHKFFYANQFARVLTDIVLPDASPLTKLYQQLIAALQAELGIIKQQHSTADMNTTTSTAFPPMITKWMAAIGVGEGANPALHNRGNLKFTTLTASWGATRGPAAKDGGYLAQFATDEMGDKALCNFLVLGCEDELLAFHAPAARTLSGFTVVFAGNPPQGYIDGIVEALGVPANTQISTFLA